MAIYTDAEGNTFASIRLNWTANTELDLAQYVVAWSRDNVDWQEMRVDRALNSCRVDGLACGVSYYFRIKAADRAGNESAWSSFNAGSPIVMSQDTVAPGNPTGLTAYSRFKAVYLKWTNPSPKDLSHVEVWRNSSASWTGATKIANVDNDSYTDEIGLWNSSFYYALKAVDATGNISSGTAWVLGQTDIVAPAAPTVLSTTTGTVVDADGHIIPYINVTWTDSTTEDVQGHEVEVQYYTGGAWWDPVTYRCRGTPLRISPAPGNVSYRVRVRALDDANLPSAWTAYSTGTTAKDNVAPAAPTSLVGTALFKAIELAWVNPTDGDFSYIEVYRHPTNDSGAATKIAELKGTKYTNEGLKVAASYYYWLKSVDTSGNKSAFTAFGLLSTDSTPPAVPTGLAVSTGITLDADGHQSAYLDCSWNANTEDDFGHYELMWTISVTGNTRSVTTKETNHRVEPVTANESYFVRVRAIDRVGNASTYCTTVSGTTSKDTVAPATPINLSVTAAKKAIRISVTKNSERDWAGNEFHVSTTNGFTPGAGTLVHSGKSTAYTHPCVSYVVHYVKVRAYDNSGNFSGYTAQGNATPEKIDAQWDIPDNNIPSDKIISLVASKIAVGILSAGVIYSDKIECSQIKAGTITATVSLATCGEINFVNGPKVYGVGGLLYTLGNFRAYDIAPLGNELYDCGKDVNRWLNVYTKNLHVISSIKIYTTEIIDSSRNLKNVVIDASTVTVSGTWLINRSLQTYDIYPAANLTYKCGTDTRKWLSVYCGTLYQGDAVFFERECAICRKRFRKGQNLVYHVVDVGEEGTRAIPAHADCAGTLID